MVAIDEIFGPLNETERKHAPTQVFIAGDVSLLTVAPRVSIVGSRKASDIGLERAARLARELAEVGVTVVSGLAEGIDAAAHRVAIAAGGRTIAVIGTPLDEVFPRAHAELQAEISKHHLVVSLFPSGAPVTRGNFPRRNRLMALISNASVIVEAGDSSGSLSHGYEALRLGRPLFFMRSMLERADVMWPSKMRGRGAKIVDTVDQILGALVPANHGLGGATASLVGGMRLRRVDDERGSKSAHPS